MAAAGPGAGPVVYGGGRFPASSARDNLISND